MGAYNYTLGYTDRSCLCQRVLKTQVPFKIWNSIYIHIDVHEIIPNKPIRQHGLIVSKTETALPL